MMINCVDFARKYYPVANASRQQDIAWFLGSLAEIIGNTPLSDALKDKSILCRAFYPQKTGSISRSHYQKIKEYLLNLFDFVGISGNIPTREEVIESQDLICYFRNINELLHFIDGVGEEKINSYNPTTDLIRVKSVCVLGWIGLTLSEISNLKKSDLIPIGNEGYKIFNGKETYEIYGEPFAALYYLSDLEEYQSLPTGNSRGRKIVLKGNAEYLFRAQDVECEKLGEQQIVNILGRFNTSTSNKKVVFRNLRKNALFLEIYNDKSDKVLLSKIIDIIGCTYNVALSYRDQYVRFAKAMDNNEI